MKYLPLALLMLIPYQGHADSAFFGFGVGLGNSAKRSTGETKVANIGYRSDIFSGIYWQNKLGYFGDGSGNPSRKSSFYFASGPGMTVDLRPVEFRSGWSLCAISTPDSYLGGRFPQFNGEIYVGLRDKKGNGIGVGYEHISSAGLVTPNNGRDFFVLQMSQSW